MLFFPMTGKNNDLPLSTFLGSALLQWHLLWLMRCKSHVRERERKLLPITGSRTVVKAMSDANWLRLIVITLDWSSSEYGDGVVYSLHRNHIAYSISKGLNKGRRRRGWQRWLDGIIELNGHESEETLGNGEGQGSLACCSPKSWTQLSEWTTTKRGQITELWVGLRRPVKNGEVPRD